MASSIVEHVVLFKVKEDTSPETLAGLQADWRGLEKLEEALELTAGPAEGPLRAGFTHALYSRYKDKAHLEAYNVHPIHQRVVKFGGTVVDNVLGVDWENSPDDVVPSSKLGAVRVFLLKPKDGVRQEDVALLLEAEKQFKALYAVGSSVGVNFSKHRNQGYEWALLLRFESVEDLAKFSSDPRQVAVQEKKLLPFVDSLIVVDLARQYTVE